MILYPADLAFRFGDKLPWVMAEGLRIEEPSQRASSCSHHQVVPDRPGIATHTDPIQPPEPPYGHCIYRIWVPYSALFKPQKAALMRSRVFGHG